MRHRTTDTTPQHNLTNRVHMTTTRDTTLSRPQGRPFRRRRRSRRHSIPRPRQTRRPRPLRINTEATQGRHSRRRHNSTRENHTRRSRSRISRRYRRAARRPQPNSHLRVHTPQQRRPIRRRNTAMSSRNTQHIPCRVIRIGRAVQTKGRARRPHRLRHLSGRQHRGTSQRNSHRFPTRRPFRSRTRESRRRRIRRSLRSHHRPINTSVASRLRQVRLQVRVINNTMHYKVIQRQVRHRTRRTSRVRRHHMHQRHHARTRPIIPIMRRNRRKRNRSRQRRQPWHRQRRRQHQGTLRRSRVIYSSPINFAMTRSRTTKPSTVEPV